MGSGGAGPDAPGGGGGGGGGIGSTGGQRRTSLKREPKSLIVSFDIKCRLPVLGLLGSMASGMSTPLVSESRNTKNCGELVINSASLKLIVYI